VEETVKLSKLTLDFHSELLEEDIESDFVGDHGGFRVEIHPIPYWLRLTDSEISACVLLG